MVRQFIMLFDMVWSCLDQEEVVICLGWSGVLLVDSLGKSGTGSVLLTGCVGRSGTGSVLW